MSEQQSAEVTETEAPATEQHPTEPIALPDDHPLVKTLAEQKKLIRDLKARTAKLDQIEESQKSEAEKAADRIRQLEEEASAARRDALRFKVASKYGIGDEDADLFLTGSDEETLTKQAERLAARIETQKKQGARVPDEGRAPATSQGSAGSVFAEFAEEFFTR